MTEEYASFKQIEFMKKLGFGPQSADLTKADARQMIDGKLREQEKAPYNVEHEGSPQPRVFDTMASKEFQEVSSPPVKKEKEFHLTPEAVKLGCLNAAIAVCERGKIDIEMIYVIELADKFVEWVYK